MARRKSHRARGKGRYDCFGYLDGGWYIDLTARIHPFKLSEARWSKLDFFPPAKIDRDILSHG